MFKPLTWDDVSKAIKRNNERVNFKKEIISYNTFIEFLENIYKDYENKNFINEWIINFGLLDIAISYDEHKKKYPYYV